MTYTKKYDWQPIEEMKGWEDPNMSDNIHKVKVREKETGNQNTQWFNFSPKQTDTGRWKKHVDQWIERLQSDRNPSVVD